jgi:hypothetical protein
MRGPIYGQQEVASRSITKLKTRSLSGRVLYPGPATRGESSGAVVALAAGVVDDSECEAPENDIALQLTSIVRRVYLQFGSRFDIAHRESSAGDDR